jgi:hypothetical protein
VLAQSLAQGGLLGATAGEDQVQPRILGSGAQEGVGEQQGAREREVPLPRGEWIETWSGRRVRGRADVVVAAPVERIPVWVRSGSIVVTYRAEHVSAGLTRGTQRDRRRAVAERPEGWSMLAPCISTG